MDKPAIIIACHTSNKMKISALKHNITKFTELSSSMFIVNSSEYRGVIEKNIPGVKVNYVDNDHLLCNSKWAWMLEKIIDKFESFILTNDSFIIVNSLERFYKTYNSARFDHTHNQMVSIVDSNEQIDEAFWGVDGESYHYPDFLRWYSHDGTRNWLDFYNKNHEKCKTTQDVINILEIGSSNVIEPNDSAYHVKSDYIGNIHFDNEMMSEWVGNVKYPIVKLKYLTTLEQDFYIPEDFDELEYKRLHSDLSDLPVEEARDHFCKHGMQEGRAYKSTQRPKMISPVVMNKLPKDVLG